MNTFTNKRGKQNKYTVEFIDWLETLLLLQNIMNFAKYGTFKCFRNVRVDCWPWLHIHWLQITSSAGKLLCMNYHCPFEHVHAITYCFLPSARYTFASGSADNIKQWMFPDGNFIQNLSGHNAIINTLAVNSDGVLVSGGN